MDSTQTAPDSPVRVAHQLSLEGLAPPARDPEVAREDALLAALDLAHALLARHVRDADQLYARLDQAATALQNYAQLL